MPFTNTIGGGSFCLLSSTGSKSESRQINEVGVGYVGP